MQEKESYRLFELALALYSKYGIRSVTMDDISRELGVSKKTIYTHVSDKKGLVGQVIEYEIDRMNHFMVEMNGNKQNAIGALIKLNKHFFTSITSHSPIFYYDLKKYYPDLFKQWIKTRRSMMIDMIKRNLSNGKNEGLYRSEIDEQIISRLYMARMEMLQDHELLTNEEFNSPQFFKEILLYHLHGICNSKGLNNLSQYHEII